MSIVGYHGIAFVHVPKTAGTSFRHQLHEELGEVYLDYNNPLFSREVEMGVSEVMRSEKFRGISGHVRGSDYLAAAKENDWALVTFVRDPIERARSHYAFLIYLCWRGLTKKDLHLRFMEERPSFLEWLSDPGMEESGVSMGS